MIRTIAGVGALVLAAMAAPLAAQDTAETRAFAEKAIAQMREAMPDASFEMEPGEPLQVNVRNTPRFEEGAINLHRVYGVCLQAEREDCEREVAGLVAMAMEKPPEMGPENLRIIVRDAEYWRAVLGMLPEHAIPQHHRIGDDLYAIIAIDSPTSIAIGAPDMIADFGLEPEAAWKLAAQQTRRILNNLPDPASLAAKPAAFVADEYMASMIFDTEAWEILAADYGPDLVVAVPSEQIVLFAIIADADLGAVREFALAECNAASRCISPNVYRFRDGLWSIAK